MNNDHSKKVSSILDEFGVGLKIVTYSKNSSFAADSCPRNDERIEDETKMVKDRILQHRYNPLYKANAPPIREL